MRAASAIGFMERVSPLRAWMLLAPSRRLPLRDNARDPPRVLGGEVRRECQGDALVADGWRVATIWECALRKPRSVEQTVAAIEEWLLSESRQLEIGETDAE